MQEFFSTLVRGLGFGSLYAMLAISFVIIYKSSRVISFAQPAMMLAGATLVTYLVGPVGFYTRYCNARLDRCFWAYKKEL